MSRPRKNFTPEEQLEKLNSDIEITENALKEMKQLRKELEIQVKTHQLEELYNIILSSGKTLDEIKNMIQDQEICA